MYSKSELLLSSNYCSDCSVIPRWWIKLIPLTFHPLPLTSQHFCPILCHGCSCSCLHTNKLTWWMPAWKVSSSPFYSFFPPSPSTIWFRLCRWWMRFLHSLLSHFHFPHIWVYVHNIFYHFSLRSCHTSFFNCWLLISCCWIIIFKFVDLVLPM